MTDTTNRPALNRRALLHRALAGAAGVAIAAPAVAPIAAAGAAMADPIMALARERRRMNAELDVHPYAHMRLGDPGYDEACQSQSDLCAALCDVEDEILSLVATTREGIIEQVDVLRNLLASPDYEQGALNVIAGLKRLPIGGAA